MTVNTYIVRKDGRLFDVVDTTDDYIVATLTKKKDAEALAAQLNAARS